MGGGDGGAKSEFSARGTRNNREKGSWGREEKFGGGRGLNHVEEGVQNPPSLTRVKRPAYHTNDYLLCHHHYDAPLLMYRIKIFFIGPERYIFHGEGTHY